MVFCNTLDVDVESSCILCERLCLCTLNRLVLPMRVEDLVLKIDPFILNLASLFDDEYESVMCLENEFMYFWWLPILLVQGFYS